MLVIKLFSWVSYAGGALCIIFGFGENSPALFMIGIASLVSGVFLHAMNYALILLKDIRDAVTSEGASQNDTEKHDEYHSSDKTQSSTVAPEKSIEELRTSLSNLSEKLEKAK